MRPAVAGCGVGGARQQFGESKLTSFGDDPAKLTPEMVSYALKVSYLRPMAEDLPDLGNCTVVKAVPNHDQLVQEARKAVFMAVAGP